MLHEEGKLLVQNSDILLPATLCAGVVVAVVAHCPVVRKRCLMRLIESSRMLERANP